MAGVTRAVLPDAIDQETHAILQSLAARRQRSLIARAAASIVVHLGKEVASTVGRHVEETPERVDKVAGAMVLFRSRKGKAHFRAPEVLDLAIVLSEDVED